MFTQFSKERLLIKVVAFIVSVNFILTSGPAFAYCSSRHAQYALRTSGAKSNPGKITDVQNGLKDPQGKLAIGFLYQDDPTKREAQIKALLGEIDKELANPGTGAIPQIAIISDYHGDAVKFSALLSDILSQLCGFKGQLNYNVSIEKQLNAQGLSLKKMKGAIYLNGDLLDRGEYGIQCFNLARELIETVPDNVFYVSGNHDFWAFGNLLGFHLPWYQGFNFYGDKEAEQLIAEQRKSHPELFDRPEAFLWWTARLAEYNEDQEKFQNEFLSGKAAELREKFVGNYKKYNSNWDNGQLDAMEDFIGYFLRIDVPDPYVGLRGMGKTSGVWWQRLHQQLMKGYEARKSAGASEDELAVWQEAIDTSDAITREVMVRLTKATSDGKWWYQIFESINTQAYKSVEWWCKDWSSHKDWGTMVIKELNDMIANPAITEPAVQQDREEFKGEKVTQANYIRSHTLQALARFYRENFNLYLKTPAGNLLSHGWFPVEEDGRVLINYKGKTYSGKEIFEGLGAVSNDVKDIRRPLQEIWEAMNLVNFWYADRTTQLKPAHEKHYREKIGIANIQSKLGVRVWASGHNPVNKLKASFMVQDGEYAHLNLDKGMAKRFGGEGAYVILGPNGITFRGFETDTSKEIVESPDTVIADGKGQTSMVIKNPGMPAKEYLENARAGLKEEFAALPTQPHLNFASTDAVNAALKGIVEVTPQGGVKVLDETALRGYLIDQLVYDATFNPDKQVVDLCRKLIKDIAVAQGATLDSVYELYVRKAHDPRQYTVPAINIRGVTYPITARRVFRSAIKNNVGPFIFEIARSEIDYTGQRPAEFTTSVLAAAIKEGYKGPVYLQGDHFQIKAKDYLGSPEKARDDIKRLIREAIEAGFYQIDLDMSVLVDWSKPTADEQQKTNYQETALLTAYVRALERELGLDKSDIVVNLGGEIGEIGMGLEKGKERNSSVEDLEAFMNGYLAELKRLGGEAGYELLPITKDAVQTGTKHGGVRDAQGKVTTAKVSFNTLAELGKVAREEYGLAGVVQHGASTLPPDYFTVFAGKSVPEGMAVDEALLNEPNKAVLSSNPVVEVHLATAYQDTTLDHKQFPAALSAQIKAYILEKFPAKPGEDPNKAFVENRKNAWGPFKVQAWNLPAGIQDAIGDSLEAQFDTVFNNLGVKDSRTMLAELRDAPGAARLPSGELNKMMWGEKLAVFADAFPEDINLALPANVREINSAKEGKAYPVLIDYESLIRASPDGIMAFLNDFKQLGEGNIKPVLHIARDDIKPEEVNTVADAKLDKINEITGGKVNIKQMFAAVVVGTNPEEVAKQVEEKFGGAGIYQVIGSAEYALRFKGVQRIVMDKANKGQITAMSKALKLSLALIPAEGKLTGEQLKKIDVLFSVDGEGNFHVASSDVTTTVSNAAEEYARQVEATDIRV